MSSNKIIINATNIGSKINGIGTYSLNIIKGLTKNNLEVHFVIYLNKSGKKHIEYFHFPKNFQIKWVSGLLSPDKKFFGHLLRLLYSNYLSIKYPRHLQFNTSPLELCFFKSNQIVTVHDIIPILFKTFHKKQYLFYRIILKYVLRNVRMIITPSTHTKKLLLKYYKLPDEKIQAIPLGVEKHCVKDLHGTKTLSPYILYVGRMNKMKNIYGIVKSFIIASRSMNVDLVIVGDNKMLLLKLLDELNCGEEVRKRIMFLENVGENEKYSLMKNALLFIYTTYYEGFGLPPLEAMQSGCPVITSNNSTLPEVCGDAAYYVNPDIESEIAEGIVEILSNDRLRKQLIQNGLQRAQKFSWEKTTVKHITIIKRILQHSRSSSEYESPELTSLIQEGLN
jgi:glycosyltransferase involved in cell wall biosynthesis